MCISKYIYNRFTANGWKEDFSQSILSNYHTIGPGTLKSPVSWNLVNRTFEIYFLYINILFIFCMFSKTCQPSIFMQYSKIISEVIIKKMWLIMIDFYSLVVWWKTNLWNRFLLLKYFLICWMVFLIWRISALMQPLCYFVFMHFVPPWLYKL